MYLCHKKYVVLFGLALKKIEESGIKVIDNFWRSEEDFTAKKFYPALTFKNPYWIRKEGDRKDKYEKLCKNNTTIETQKTDR